MGGHFLLWDNIVVPGNRPAPALEVDVSSELSRPRVGAHVCNCMCECGFACVRACACACACVCLYICV